ncbi:MAG: hypothetical protein V3S71_03100, partial [Acidobacteriota bacterium]
MSKIGLAAGVTILDPTSIFQLEGPLDRPSGGKQRPSFHKAGFDHGRTVMKKGLHLVGIVLALSALVLACSGPMLQPVLDEPGAVITPRPDASVDLFFDDLSPYGEWVWVSGPGWVWYP